MRSPMQSSPATAYVGAAPAAIPAAPAQPDAITAPGGGPKEEDRRSLECGGHVQLETVTNHHLQSSSISDMLWGSPDGSCEKDSDLTFLSKLANTLPEDSSDEEDQEALGDWRYARSKRLMKALLDSKDSGDSEDSGDPEEDEDRTQKPKEDRMYARSEYLKKALLDSKDSGDSENNEDPEDDEGSGDEDGTQVQAVGDIAFRPGPMTDVSTSS
jgi:hypothetical protein